MKKIKIVDTAFSHGKTTTDIQISKYIEWDRSEPKDDDIVFITDNSLYYTDRIKGEKIGLLIEPMQINDNIYRWVIQNKLKLKNILTYDKDVLDTCENSLFYPHGGCWIFPDDQKIYDKSKNVSIICSEKRETQGHRLRHLVVEKLNSLRKDFDLYGRGYNPIDNKITALKDYRFSIVIENSKKDYYFTEKLIDCFRTGTIPIYWGCPSIGDFFDISGILTFNNEDDLIETIESLSEDLYKSKLESIIKNYELAKKYLLIENWIHEELNLI